MNSVENVKAYYATKSYTNLSQKAYDMLLELILSMVLEPDRLYSELELSSMIDVGRTPVREAVQKLQSNMLVDVIPRSGIKIAPLKLEDFYLQIEVRRVLEKLIISRAARFATDAERQYIRELSGRYRAAAENKDDITSLRTDKEFHEYIATCARNPFAKKALEPFQILEQRLFYIQYKAGESVISRINELHLLLMKEIVNGNIEGACAYSDTMLDCTEKLVHARMTMWTSH